MKHLLILAALAAGLALPAHAEEPRERGVETRIPFADSIRNFHADDDRGVWIQDNRDRWYYASLAGPCFGMDFTHKIGVVTRGTSALDSFGAIVVDGQRCPITSLVTSAPPPGHEPKSANEE